MITLPQVVDTQEQATAVIHLIIPGRNMLKYMDPAIQEIIKLITGQGISMTGPMFSYHHRRPSDTFDFEVGFPVSKAIREEGRVINSKLPAAKVVRSVYQGPYEGLAQAWGVLQNWVREKTHGETGRFWESYRTDLNEVKDPKNSRTELNWIVKEN